MRGTALAEGIGEKLTSLPGLPRCYVLVGKPGINVSTKLAYENLKLDSIQKHPDIDGMLRDIENQDLKSLTSKMENVFEPGIIRQYPVIQEIKDLMEANGALKAMMSGSGPTVFGIFDDRAKMREAAEVPHEPDHLYTESAAPYWNAHPSDILPLSFWYHEVFFAQARNLFLPNLKIPLWNRGALFLTLPPTHPYSDIPCSRFSLLCHNHQ